jgi:membrane protein YdbS with pleckstrin-like domain
MHLGPLIHQKSYEKIEYLLRRHPITFVPKLFIFLILLIIPVIIEKFSVVLFPGILQNQSIYVSGIVLGTIYYMTTILLFYGFFIDYYLDIWVITNDRIIDMEQRGIFARTITEFDLFQIQDITTEINGLAATLFHYGNISVTTSSSNSGIVFYQIPDPNSIRSKIITLAEEDRKYHIGNNPK